MGMWSHLKGRLVQVFNVDPHERSKLFYLTAAFFCVIASYTMAKEMKDIFFVNVVGREYIPIARTLLIFVLMPAIFLYAKLVDKVRRYQLLGFCSLFFGIIGLICAYLISHPTIGLPNTNAGPHRLFGWIFYFLIEGYSPFLVSVFWAFANSVTSPDAAKKDYGLMVSGSKVGGMLGAGIGWLLFSWGVSGAYTRADNIATYQLVYVISLCMLLMVPFILWRLMKNVPGRYLHGYEAAYKAEKQKKREGKEKTGMFAGLAMLVRYPYVLGIFGMVYFYEVIGTVLSYLRLGVAEANADSLSGMGSYLFLIMFQAHAVGLIISLFGTRALLNRLGTRGCLMLIPILCGGLLLYALLSGSPYVFGTAYALLKSVNLAFSLPVRESLYIPTIKEIKFKSKSWIDAFGNKFAKTSGSAFNYFSAHLSTHALMPLHSFFFAGIIALWFVVAVLLGRRFERAITNGEVIGIDEKVEG